MTGPRRFDPRELDDLGLTGPELADVLAAGRELERVGTDDPRPSSSFTDRVMAAVADEADPRPVAAVTRAVRDARPAGIIVALQGAWRTAFGSGRPLLVRAQAASLLLLAALGMGLVGGVVAIGASQLLAPLDDASPAPSVQPTAPTATPELTPSPSPSPSVSPSPSPSVGPTASPEPTETAEPTSPTGGTGGPTSSPTDTPEPTETDEPDDTPDPDDTPGPTDDSGDSSGSGSGDD